MSIDSKEDTRLFISVYAIARNAAMNILRVGMSTLGRDEVRRLSAREVA